MTPKVRFKGFDDAWEQRKLKEITSRVQGNDGRVNLQTLTISAGNGWMKQEDRFSANIAGKEQKNYTLLKKGELAYNHGNSKLAKFGAVFELKDFDEALVPRVYHSFRVNNKTNSSFIEYMFATKLPDKELGKLVSSGARMDGLLNIGYEDFVGINITVPSLEEQQKIAYHFRKLDEVITLHQRQCDALKKQKQFFLQNMFPKEGESVPRIRFNGFTEPWEQRKLGDCFSERSERSSKGELIAVTINSGVVKASSLDRHDNSSQDKSNYKVVMKNDIAYNSMRMWQGACGVSAYNGILSPAYTVVIPNTNIDSSFFAFMFKRYDVIHKFRINSQGLTSDTWNLKFPAFSKISIKVPSFNEQKKISNLFNEIEKSITLHQQQYEQLVSLKKYLLSKMFI